MFQVHILNGDALASQLRGSTVEGNVIVCRECLMDGPTQEKIDNNFWELRADFIHSEFNESRNEYFRIRDEFGRLKEIPTNSEINFWFENDLFCQANYWFSLAFVKQNGLQQKSFRVYPPLVSSSNKWATFGDSKPADLTYSLLSRKEITASDLSHGEKLWRAFSSSNLNALRELCDFPSEAFQYQDEVVQAHFDRFPRDKKLGRPETRLKQLNEKGTQTFGELFRSFAESEAIYGFGDTQVKKMLERINQA